MKHIVILEDHSDAQQWLRAVAEQALQPDSIAIYGTLSQALAALEHSQPDLALVDLNLPDGSGLEYISAYQQASNTAYSVVTTIYDDDLHLFPALAAGAKGYLLKEQSKSKLVAALQGILEGEPAISPQISLRMISHFRELERKKNLGSELIKQLTPREIEVLSLISKGHTANECGKILTLSKYTVSGYIKSIYEKLEINSRAEATTIALSHGLI
ncbi:Transcriptional regulatory protein DegU [Sinobacterium norvegicum]|uniref:Transcriptional regulatory protein DegU n=1 Tax=Sinobacterium norvegicum TaxID=1641715 RepID=A0ABM9ADF6_9GAMM|nr:response regulator transcription factor [Sinobacterium norvegicum]CAH0990975.1 Transcriptional regulatory protein DegU [Sinobacterium norvegicum]